ncbi:hypothetical protein RFI_30559, partial [Reticulomyxa filosa]
PITANPNPAEKYGLPSKKDGNGISEEEPGVCNIIGLFIIATHPRRFFRVSRKQCLTSETDHSYLIYFLLFTFSCENFVKIKQFYFLSYLQIIFFLWLHDGGSQNLFPFSFNALDNFFTTVFFLYVHTRQQLRAGNKTFSSKKKKESTKKKISQESSASLPKEKADQEQKTAPQNSSYDTDKFDDPKRFIRGDDYTVEQKREEEGRRGGGGGGMKLESKWRKKKMCVWQKELSNLRSTDRYKKYAELYPRKLVQIKTSGTNKGKVKIMQFNVLADGLSGLYVNSKMKDKEFVGVSKDALEFNYRGFRIVEEILRHDPDIVTLEEVDQFEVDTFFKINIINYI